MKILSREPEKEKRHAVKVIAVDIDDVLNNFSETLAQTTFEYKDAYGLSRDQFQEYLALVKQDTFPKTEFLTTKFSDFRYRIHEQCYQMAKAQPEGVSFMQWLKKRDWKVVICTKRNLKLAGENTKAWFKDNDIPYDQLFMVLNKVVFCKLWDISYLVDDDPLNIFYGGQYGVQVFYPGAIHYDMSPPFGAKAFNRFEEIQAWIEK